MHKVIQSCLEPIWGKIYKHSMISCLLYVGYKTDVLAGQRYSRTRHIKVIEAIYGQHMHHTQIYTKHGHFPVDCRALLDSRFYYQFLAASTTLNHKCKT